MSNKRIVLIIHNVRSAHNIGSILRSADGFGVEQIYISGYSPYPIAPSDKRLPHVALRAEKQISKTALGAEKSVKWQHCDDAKMLVAKLKKNGFKVVALEQTARSSNLPDFKIQGDIALIVGSEIDGIDQDLLKLADAAVQIPMDGVKESFNVAVAAAIALYHLRHKA